MAEEADDWAPVATAEPQDDWAPVGKQEPNALPDISLLRFLPKPFLDRVYRGEAMSRALKAAKEGFGEGFGNEPVGMSAEHVQQLQEAGIYRDPVTGRGGAIRLANESILQPAAALGDFAMRSITGGVHALGHIAGQVAEDMGAEGPKRLQSEVINFLNYQLLRGDHQFGRPDHSPAGPRDQAIGRLPTEVDFKRSAELLGGEATSLPPPAAGFTRFYHGGSDPASGGGRWVAPNYEYARDYRPGEPVSYVDVPNDSPLLRKSFDDTGTDQIAPYVSFEAPEEIAKNLKPFPVPAAEANLRRMWEEDGIHPAEAVHDAQTDAFLKQELTRPETDPATKLPPEAWSPENLAERPYELPAEPAGESLRALGSDVTRDTPDLTQQPAPPPGRVSAAVKDAGDKILDIGRDIQMLVAPMARGTTDSMAVAKDFANSLRRNRWEWSRIDADIEKRFTPEQRKRMWDAADEESVARQLGERREHQGLITLEPEERAAVEQLQARAQVAWLQARDLGMVEGEGLPAYTPRMVINTAEAVSGDKALSLNGIGRNLRVTTPGMKRRKYMTAEETEAAAKGALGEGAEIARDIRALPLATGRLEDAIAGRTLIDNIKDIGKRTGMDTVAEGGKPAGSEFGWFTIDHPAFRTWRPKFETDAAGKVTAALDKNGDVIFQQVPLYVRSDFEGPLRAVLTQSSGPLYGAAMALKGKTMGLIMNSPMIHNFVEWGRALPAMPGKVATFKVYFEGNRAKNDVAVMREAIDSGLVPIGKRFFNQDITSIMEAPDLAPGRSWTAKVLGFVPGLFDAKAEAAVRTAVDKAGDFWHNTLLWDRIADLQMGLYSNLRSDMIAKGIDQQTASRAAAHWANRYAGALPQEAMSDGARKVANMLLFSRSFTLGNIGVMKDMLTGLPKDVLAQIDRDVGIFDPAAKSYIKNLAARKAIGIVIADMVLMYVGNSVLQSALTVMRGERTMDEEMHGYTQRLSAVMQETKEHPLSLLSPLSIAGAAIGAAAGGVGGAIAGGLAGTATSAIKRLSSTSENEPGKQDRIKVGYTKDGTAIYARSPAGKIGEEFEGYFSGPLDMLRRKLGTIARPGWQILSNDAGFGRKVYDPGAETIEQRAWVAGQIAAHLAKSQTPEGQIRAGMDLVKGEGDKNLNLAQTFGPFAGVTFGKGAPGGPAVGEVYAARTRHQYAVDAALPDIRRQIQRGDVEGASERMTELGIAPGLQKFYIRTSINPSTRLSGRTLRDFYLYSTEEQRQRLENAR